MVLPPSGDVGNIDALFRAPENIGKSLQRNILLVVKTTTKKCCLQPLAQVTERKKREAE